MAFYDTWDSNFPVYDFRMDEVSGGLFNTGTGTDFDAGETGSGATYEQAGPVGGADKSILFDGSASYYDDSNAAFGREWAATGTIAIAFKAVSGVSDFGMLLHLRRVTSPFSEIMIRLENTTAGLLFVNFEDGGGNNRRWNSASGYKDDNWNLLILRQKNDGTELEIFMNGVDITPVPTTNGTPPGVDDFIGDIITSTVGDTTRLGHNKTGGTQFFEGNIALLGISETAISDADIALLNSGASWGGTISFSNKTIRRTGRRLFSPSI